MKNDDNKEKKKLDQAEQNLIDHGKSRPHVEHDFRLSETKQNKNSTDGTTQYSIFLAEYKCGSNETKFVRLMNKITSTDVTK